MQKQERISVGSLLFPICIRFRLVSMHRIGLLLIRYSMGGRFFSLVLWFDVGFCLLWLKEPATYDCIDAETPFEFIQYFVQSGAFGIQPFQISRQWQEKLVRSGSESGNANANQSDLVLKKQTVQQRTGCLVNSFRGTGWDGKSRSASDGFKIRILDF